MRRALALLWLCACPKTTPAPEAPPEDLPSDMQLHYELATKARDGVIRGQLEVARAAGQTLHQHSDARLPPSWQPYLGKVNEAAAVAMAAPNLDTAAGAVAQLALTCANCHDALGGGPEFTMEQPPPAGKAVRDKMARHQWAADRMWEGLITGDDRRYQAGAEAIAGAPVWGEAPLPEAVQAIEWGVRESARVALAATTDEVRVVAYAQLLATCAKCHEVARP